MSVRSCAVWVLVNGGAPSRSLKGGPSERRPTAQVRVRGPRGGTKGGFKTGLDLAGLVFASLHDTRPAGFCSISSLDSGPSNLGRDANGAPEWSMNFEVIIDVTPGDPTPDVAEMIRDVIAAAGLGLEVGVSLFASDRPPVDR